MLSISVEYPTDWKDYELIDTGEGMKLERFATYIVARPDPRILWTKRAPETTWNEAHAMYVRTSATEGHWKKRVDPPTPWLMRYGDLTFTLRPTEFKHVGVFPEQATNWDWIDARARGLKILNLFAYTGGATLAAASAGAFVTHVDSVRSVITWARENAALSNLDKTPIRWIEDDVYKFVVREGRRGSAYDGIVMDPPRFGRGTKGEVWKIEEDLPKLLEACKKILSPKPAFFLINAYTADLSSLVLHHLLRDILPGGKIEYAELALKDSIGGRLLPNGIFARWSI